MLGARHPGPYTRAQPVAPTGGEKKAESDQAARDLIMLQTLRQQQTLVAILRAQMEATHAASVRLDALEDFTVKTTQSPGPARTAAAGIAGRAASTAAAAAEASSKLDAVATAADAAFDSLHKLIAPATPPEATQDHGLGPAPLADSWKLGGSAAGYNPVAPSAPRYQE